VTTPEALLHDLDEVLALPHRSVVKDARNRMFQIQHRENGNRRFYMFGDEGLYNMDGNGPLMFTFPVTLMWRGEEVLLTGGYEDTD
jgi:hypothetical protein